MKIEIKNRLTGEVIFAHEAEENSMKITVLAAIEVNADLSNANLSNADLSNANLRYANLHNADLSNANLSNANLSNADLSNADLSNANLRYANLSNADLRYANLRYADIDFSFGWQFACWHSRFSISMKFAYQVLTHLCSCKCDDPEFAELREKILPYAQKSHRAGDLELK